MSSLDNPLIFPLTEQDRKDLKKGKEVMKHFHNILFPDDTIAVVASPKRLEKSDYEYLLLKGIDVCTVRTDVKPDFWEKLEEGVWMASYNTHHGFHLYVCIIYEEDLGKVFGK
jgi:hypothetical protein